MLIESQPSAGKLCKLGQAAVQTNYTGFSESLSPPHVSNGDSLLLVDDSDQYESFIFTLRERIMVV